jgi:hypothetical protein
MEQIYRVCKAITINQLIKKEERETGIQVLSLICFTYARAIASCMHPFMLLPTKFS